MADYANDAYLRSLAGSTSDVNRQVSNALTEINRQRTVAGGQTAQIPGAVNPLYNEGSARLSGDLSNLGLQQMSSVSQAFDNSKASYGRVASLMDQGFGEQATSQRGAVRGIGQDLIGDLRTKAADFVSQREAEDRQRAFQAQQAASDRAFAEQQQQQQIAANQSLAAESTKQSEYERAVDEWLAGLDGRYVQTPTVDLASQAKYLAMKDRQLLGLDATSGWTG